MQKKKIAHADIIIAFLQMSKVRLTEVKWFTQGQNELGREKLRQESSFLIPKSIPYYHTTPLSSPALSPRQQALMHRR